MIKNLKLLREERGWSQQKVTDMLNLTKQTVFKYEQKSNEPDIATLIRLADIFEVSVDFLISDLADTVTVHLLKGYTSTTVSDLIFNL